MLHLHSIPAGDEALFGHPPLYQSVDGQVSSDPLALAGPQPTFSLRKLALYLSSPVLVGEFAPDSPWSGVSLLRLHIPWPGQATSRTEELVTQFQSSIRRCMGNAATVAVAASAGLDSTALLLHAGTLCQQEERRLIAILIDLVDDTGQSSAEVMLRLIEQLHLPCERLVIISGDEASLRHAPEAVWSPHGPRAETWPQLGRAMAEVAASWGAGVLLTGSGADELLASTRYLLPHLLRKLRREAAWSYLRDLAKGGHARLGTEAFSLFAPLLPSRLANQLYWMCNWPELCSFQVSPVIADPYRTIAQQWAAHWIASTLSFHAAHGKSWARADAWDALFPLDRLPDNGIPKAYPFLDPEFARYAMALPLEERFSPRFASPYHRAKALVMRLYPEEMHDRLPQTKQLFAQAFCTSHAQRHALERARHCLAYGLVREEELVRCQDTVLLWKVAALDRWIAGAEERGATADP